MHKMHGTLIRIQRTKNSLALTWLTTVAQTAFLVSEEWRKKGSRNVRVFTSVDVCRDTVLIHQTESKRQHELCLFTARQAVGEMEKHFGDNFGLPLIPDEVGETDLHKEWDAVQRQYRGLKTA